MTELHPIQLREILVSHLSVDVHDHQKATEYEGDVELSIKTATSDTGAANGKIVVGVRASVEPKPSEVEDGKPLFSIEVELRGLFDVDLSKFSAEHLPEWAKRNAPFLLLPYVREQVYGLALRSGVKGMVFPLMVQPRAIPRVNSEKEKLS